MMFGVSLLIIISALVLTPAVGWTSPDGREFGAIGQTDGTAFVEVNADGSLRYLGRLPTQTVNSDWRDMKVINGFVYIGAESRNHGLQIFDMRKVRFFVYTVNICFLMLTTHSCLISNSQGHSISGQT